MKISFTKLEMVNATENAGLNAMNSKFWDMFLANGVDMFKHPLKDCMVQVQWTKIDDVLNIEADAYVDLQTLFPLLMGMDFMEFQAYVMESIDESDLREIMQDVTTASNTLQEHNPEATERFNKALQEKVLGSDDEDDKNEWEK